MKRRTRARGLTAAERRLALAAFILPPGEIKLPAWWSALTGQSTPEATEPEAGDRPNPDHPSTVAHEKRPCEAQGLRTTAEGAQTVKAKCKADAAVAQTTTINSQEGT